jgi:acetyl-CoA carboxylase carboxyl transferase subunit alpha
MKITSDDLKALGVIDGIIPEPIGGAHRDPSGVIAATGKTIESALKELTAQTGSQLRAERRQKFLDIGRSL